MSLHYLLCFNVYVNLIFLLLNAGIAFVNIFICASYKTCSLLRLFFFFFRACIIIIIIIILAYDFEVRDNENLKNCLNNFCQGSSPSLEIISSWLFVGRNYCLWDTWAYITLVVFILQMPRMRVNFFFLFLIHF